MTTTSSTTFPCAPAQDQSTTPGPKSKSWPHAPADFGWVWTEMLKLPSLPFPPSINHYWLRNKNGSVRVSAEGKTYRERVMWKLNRAVKHPLQGMLAVDIVIDMPDKRRRDLDNLTKCLLDSLTASGVWIDDSQIADLRIRKSEKIGGCVEVTIWR